jgi:hypothetical protein
LKKGQAYKHNPDISFMKTSERSLFLLQQLGIQVSQNEYLGIKLHDGLYEEGNKGYYMSFSEEYRLRSNLPYIVHQADLLATRIEHDNIVSQPIQSKSKPWTKSSPNTKPIPTKDINKTLPPPSPKSIKSKFSSLLNSI